jgi:phosphoglycerate dehydrogenase-like enzyme
VLSPRKQVYDVPADPEGEPYVPLAWVPYADSAEAERRLGGIPAGLELDFYRADGEELPATIGEVAFYVLPYMKGPSVLDKVADMPRLRVAQTLTAGYEEYLPLLPTAVTLCNAAGVHDASTAELAVALALASGRHLDLFARNQLTGTWDHRPGRSLADQRVLIVGYGRIGAAIEARLQGFEVTSVTRVARRGRIGPPPVHPIDDLPELLPEADVVFVTAPLTPATEGLIGARELGLLPEGALLVNVARGKLVDTGALLAALSAGRITAALDVTDPEPLPADHPLWRAPGALISPHIGGASTAFAPRADRLIAAQLARFAADQPLAHVVRPALR